MSPCHPLTASSTSRRASRRYRSCLCDGAAVCSLGCIVFCSPIFGSIHLRKANPRHLGIGPYSTFGFTDFTEHLTGGENSLESLLPLYV